MIPTIKKSIKKSLKGNDEPSALLAARTSPGPENNTPPVTLFYNCTTTRTLLPSMNKDVCIIVLNTKKTLPPLKVNDSVHLQQENLGQYKQNN